MAAQRLTCGLPIGVPYGIAPPHQDPTLQHVDRLVEYYFEQGESEMRQSLYASQLPSPYLPGSLA